MNRIHSGWVLATIGALSFMAAAAYAEDAPPPAKPTPGVPAIPAVPAKPEDGAPATDQPVNLAFKYTTGQLQRFRATSKADLAMDLGGAGGGLGTLPLGMQMAMVLQQKVTGTHQGTATVAAKVDSVSMTMDAMGQKIQIQRKNGKTTVAGPNGMNLGGAGTQMLEGSLKGLTGSGQVFHQDAFGNISGGNSGMSSLGVGEMPGLLPDHPVKVGETWERSQKVHPPTPGGAGGGAGGAAAKAFAPPDIEVKVTYTLKSVETKGGKMFALIESSGSGATPSDAQGMMVNENITGTTRFDIARGVVTSGSYNVDITFKMALQGLPGLPGGNAQPGGGDAPAPNLQIQGTISATMVEIPNGPAKKAAPAKRKPHTR